MQQPKLYHESSPPGENYGIKFLKYLEGKIKWNPNEKVLDIGCGPGNFTIDVFHPFLPHDATLVGCDKSKEVIDYANNVFKNSGVTFKEMDIESTEIWATWEKELFTKIFSFHLMHWLTNHRVAVENMYSLLKPKGELYLTYFAEHKSFEAFRKIRNFERWKNFIQGWEGKHFEWSVNTTVEDRKNRIFDLLKHAGFQEIEVIVREGVNNYNSPEHFLSVVHSLDPYRKYIPDELKVEYNVYFENVMKNLLSECPETGQPFMKVEWFAIRAKKN